MVIRILDKFIFSGGQEYHQSSIRSIVVGVVIGAITFSVLSLLVAAIAFDSDAVEAPFLFIPNQLGLIPSVTREQVKPVSASGFTDLEFSNAGTYILYSTDPTSKDSLIVTSRDEELRLSVYSKYGETSRISPDLVKGAPMSAFDIPKSGSYILSPLIVRPLGGFLPLLYLAPDYSGIKRTYLFVSILITLGIVISAGELTYHFATREQRNRENAAKQEKARKLDEWMKTVNK